MDLIEMVVTEECGATNPYWFKAKEPSETDDHGIQLVMPLGGVESGLYRSPKQDEKVLVGVTGEGSAAQYYLMGYLPDSTSNNFGHKKPAPSPDSDQADMKTLLDDNGEVFRYKQTGKKDTKENGDYYSEIGFYQKPTAWAPKDKDDYNNLSGGYPKIDRINIHSTGDIHTSAVNHQEIKAKRLAMLADCKEGGKDATDHGDLDRPGDDSTLYEGDLHIRAKKRIVIKAGESICLKVGRSSIIIDDSCITIVSRRTHSNIENYYDTALSLSPVLGITAAAGSITLNSIYGASLKDGLGGGISTESGITRITGKDVRVQAFPYTNYLANFVGFATAFSEGLGSIQAGLAEQDTDSKLGISTNKFPALIGKVGTPVIAIAVNKLLEKRLKGPETKETPLDSAISLIDTIRTVSGIVFTILDAAVPAAVSMASEEMGGDVLARNSLAMAQIATEFGISLAFFNACTTSCLAATVPRILHTSYLNLTATAESILLGFESKVLNASESTEAQGPLIALEGDPDTLGTLKEIPN
jgi:hypothetical protein